MGDFVEKSFKEDFFRQKICFPGVIVLMFVTR